MIVSFGFCLYPELIQTQGEAPKIIEDRGLVSALPNLCGAIDQSCDLIGSRNFLENFSRSGRLSQRAKEYVSAARRLWFRLDACDRGWRDHAPLEYLEPEECGEALFGRTALTMARAALKTAYFMLSEDSDLPTGRG